MSGMISDTYAVVDKSKKTKSRNKASTQLPLNPVADLYSVVDKSHKSKPDSTTLTEDTYEAVPAENLYYNTVVAATDESAALYDSASAPTYSKLDHIQVPLAVVDNTVPKKQTLVAAEAKHIKKLDRQQKKNTLPCCVIASFTVLIIAVIVAAVAIATTFVLIAGLRSDLTAALKDSSSSSGSITEKNPHVTTNNMESQLNMLRTDIKNFSAAINQQVEYLNQNASNGIDNIDQQINITCESLRELQYSIALLSSSVGTVEGNFTEQLNGVSNTATAMLKILNNEIIEVIMNSSDISVTIITTLQDRLANGVQTLHIFNSCEAVSNFSFQLPSGMYQIRAGNSSIIEYCSNIIAFSCHGIPGRWKRIAYLSNDTSPVVCPTGFEFITDPNVPALCKRSPTGAICSPITYSTNGNSYSQVCGTIHGSYFGDPDGFNSYTSIRSRHAGTSLNGNYVDGISLTHGSMNEHHIWTLSAIVNLANNPNDICSVCTRNKPSYVGMDYSCDVVGTQKCGSGCSPRQIWVDGQCKGNNTFYKNLKQLTSDDIEMRLCADQPKDDEDIFLSYIEIYVM